MANVLYPLAKKAFLDADIDLLADDLKVALVTSSYSYSASHQYRSDLGANILTDGVSGNLSTKSTTAGVFDADNVTLATVTGSQTAAAIILFKDTGSSGTSPLIAYWDTGVTGLPFSTTGGDITVTWSDGSNKIFALTDA